MVTVVVGAGLLRFVRTRYSKVKKAHRMKAFLLSIFVFFAVFATVYSLKCYSCIGTEDSCSKEKLEDGTGGKKDTCISGLDKCMRTWAKKGDATAVVNSCSNEAGCKAAEEVCDKADGDCKVGCCDEDLCNAGSPVSFSVFLMTVCSALGLALLK